MSKKKNDENFKRVVPKVYCLERSLADWQLAKMEYHRISIAKIIHPMYVTTPAVHAMLTPPVSIFEKEKRMLLCTIRHLEAAKQKLTATIEQLELDNDQLERDNQVQSEHLRASEMEATDAIDRMNREIEAHVSDKAQLAHTSDALSHELAAVESAHGDVLAMYNDACRKNAQLVEKQKVDAVHVSMLKENAERSAKKFEKEIHDKSASVDDLKQRTKEYAQQLVELGRENNKLSELVDVYKFSIREHEKDTKVKSQSLADTRKELQKYKSISENYKKQLKDLRSRIERLSLID